MLPKSSNSDIGDTSYSVFSDDPPEVLDVVDAYEVEFVLSVENGHRFSIHLFAREQELRSGVLLDDICFFVLVALSLCSTQTESSNTKQKRYIRFRSCGPD